MQFTCSCLICVEGGWMAGGKPKQRGDVLAPGTFKPDRETHRSMGVRAGGAGPGPALKVSLYLPSKPKGSFPHACHSNRTFSSFFGGGKCKKQGEVLISCPLKVPDAEGQSQLRPHPIPALEMQTSSDFLPRQRGQMIGVKSGVVTNLEIFG